MTPQEFVDEAANLYEIEIEFEEEPHSDGKIVYFTRWAVQFDPHGPPAYATILIPDGDSDIPEDEMETLRRRLCLLQH